MSELYELYESNPTLENDGVWVSFGKTTRVKIRRMNSQKVREAHKKFSAPHSHYDRSGRDMPDDVTDDIAVSVIADAVIADWEVLDKGGKPLSNSFKVKYETISDSKLKNFRDAIAYVSTNQASYKSEMDEDSEGNS